MQDEDKTKERLIIQLHELRERFAELEKDKVEHKRAEEVMKRYELLCENALEIILFISEDGRILEANEAALRAYGYDREAILSCRIDDLRAPETRALLPEQMEKAFLEGIYFETVHLRRNGEVFPVAVSSRGVKLGGDKILMNVIRDITERKRAEEALKESKESKESKERFRTLANATWEGIIIHKEGIIIEANESASQLVQYPVEEIIGKSIIDFLAPEYIEPAMQKFREGFTGDQLYLEVKILRKDKTVISAEALGRPIRYNNVDARVIAFRDITERKRNEEALKESKEKYREIFDSSNDALFIQDIPSGSILDVNKKMLEMFGYDDKREALKCTIEDLSAVEEGYNEEKIKEMNKKATDSKSNSFEWRSKKKDGEKFWSQMLLQNTQIGGENRILSSVQDITELKRAEEALSKDHRELQETAQRLEQSMGMLQLVLESIPVRVFWKDKDLRYLGCNTLFARDAGLSRPDQLLGLDDFAIGWREQAELYRADDRKVMESGLPKMNIVEPQTTPTGGKIWLNTSKVPLHLQNGEVFGILGIYEDITEHMQAEEERRTLQERLQRAEKMEALGILAGGVAHDLNNVLGIVVGYSELLVGDLDESSSERSIAKEILKGGQRAAAIVQDLLTMARRGIQGKEVLNINNILQECLKSSEFAKLSSYNPKIGIKTDFEADLLRVSGSSVHIGKSFLNLITNASEAMPDGGVITIKTGNQYLDKPISGYDEVRGGDYVVLSISDTGEGIPSSDLKRIFEPFYTKKVMGRRSGTGLGLAVVWGTVKDHHGYINVESEEGKGTTFTLYFPVTREELSPEEAAVSASEYMGKNETILVVDDVKEQRELASMMLKKLNYTVESVSSGEEAVEYVKKHTVDLLVLDMIMDPGMDGLDTYLKILEIHPHQKAVIVSGFSETERVTKAQELGAGAYVKKPYVLEKLGLAVRKELERST